LPEKTHAEAKRLLRLGELLSLRGHTAAAIDPFERAYAQVGVRLPQLGLRLAQALQGAGQSARAEQIVAKTVQAYPDLAEAQNLYASLLLPHAPQRALAPLRASSLHNPFNPSVHRMWAQALEAVGDSAGHAREARFAKLCEAPRAVAAPPPAPQGTGRARLITAPWGTVRIDAEPRAWATPAWDLPLRPGSHHLRATATHHKLPVTGAGTLDVAAGGMSLWAMPLRPASSAAQSP
jgi:predicted Zn-dependent protease